MRLKTLLILSTLLLMPLSAGLKHLTLSRALALLDKNNLEIKIAQYDSQMKKYDQFAAEGQQYGKLDLTMMAMRSNDAGNVFGFKLQSREATFGDFGFSDFLGGIGGVMQAAGGDFTKFSAMMSNPVAQQQMLDIAPTDLNFPEARNHFTTKLTYMLPVYTGGKLTEYKNITKALFFANSISFLKSLLLSFAPKINKSLFFEK